MDKDSEDLSDTHGKLGRAETIADQLDKRHRERQQQLTAKHELNRQHLAKDESLDYFQQTFRAHVAAIEIDLARLTPNSDRIKLTNDIHKIAEDTHNLQNYLTASTLFLSNYTVKTCQEIVNDLKSRIEATKDTLLAKKKFNFRSKATTSITAVDGPATKPSNPIVSNAKVNHFEWTVENRQNQEIVLLSHDTNGKDITISCISNCILRIEGHPSSLQLSQLDNCILLCGPISRSVFAEKCANCKMAFGCQQLRLHSSQKCSIFGHVTCRTIIEDSHDIQVAPYNYRYENVDEDFVKAGLDLSKNNWEDVADFNWLSTETKSPHWQRMEVDERSPVWLEHCQQFRDKFFN